MRKRILILMSLVFSLMVTCVSFASSLSNDIKKCKTVPEYSSNTKAENMDTLTFGNYKGEALKWIVLEKQEELALLLSQKVIDGCTYNGPDEFDLCAYENSYLKEKMDEFYDEAFNGDEKSLIADVYSFGNAFPLSEDEINLYFSGSKNKQMAKGTDYAKYESKALVYDSGYAEYWLRDNLFIREENDHIIGKSIDENGNIANRAAVNKAQNSGMRPAIWVFISSTQEDNYDNEVRKKSTVKETYPTQEKTTLIYEKKAETKRVQETTTQQAKTKENEIVESSEYENIDPDSRPFMEWHAKLVAEEKRKDDEHKRLASKIYYLAKQESKSDKMYKSVKKNTIRDGLLDTGIFAMTNKKYYNVDITLNSKTTERLSRYAEIRQDKYYVSSEWLLLAGDSMNKLESITEFGLTPESDDTLLGLTEGFTYYQKGRIRINCKSKDIQDETYEKILNSKVLVLASFNVIKSRVRTFEEEVILGGFTRFESQESSDKLNWVKGYVDCENEIINYTKDHIGYSLYAKGGDEYSMIYNEMISEPLHSCRSLDILAYGVNSQAYAKYVNYINYLGKNTSAAVREFTVYGGKIKWKVELNLNEGFEDFENYYRYYLESRNQ